MVIQVYSTAIGIDPPSWTPQSATRFNVCSLSWTARILRGYSGITSHANFFGIYTKLLLSQNLDRAARLCQMFLNTLFYMRARWCRRVHEEHLLLLLGGVCRSSTGGFSRFQAGVVVRICKGRVGTEAIALHRRGLTSFGYCKRLPCILRSNYFFYTPSSSAIMCI